MAMKRVAEKVRKEERAARKEARRAQAPAPEAGETIETLAEKLRQAQQQLKGRQTRVRKLEDWVRKHAAGKAILMSKGLYRQIHKALHPDLANSDAKENRRLTELAQEFNNYEIEHSDA